MGGLTPDRILAAVQEKMGQGTGSVTLHFKDGAVQQVEYRTFEKIAPK